MTQVLSRNIFVCMFLCLSVSVSLAVVAGDAGKAYELLYDEQEPGTDIYRNRYLVTDNYLRIDEPGEDNGYILFDNSKHTVYSVSHGDQSILVIKAGDYTRPELDDSITIEYSLLPEAPTISGRQVYNYRVVASEAEKDVCMDIQLVKGLLPEVAAILNAYQKVVASQQARVLKNTPEEYRTSCFLYDQIYNDGRYYEKGLPVQEWHSNGRKKLLFSYKTIDIDPARFAVPESYRQYSIE